VTDRVKRQRGRPKLAPQDKRTGTVKVQLTAEERKTIESLADGRKLSAYLRDKGLAQ